MARYNGFTREQDGNPKLTRALRSALEQFGDGDWHEIFNIENPSLSLALDYVPTEDHKRFSRRVREIQMSLGDYGF